MKKPYIAKDSQDPGLIEPGEVDPQYPRPPSDRALIIRICEKLGVATE